jgi:hypothetical protein
MRTGDYDDAIRIAIRQIIEDWESGKTEAQPAMAAIAKLIDYVLPREDRPEGVVYPFADHPVDFIIDSDPPPEYCAGSRLGEDEEKK